MIKKCEICHKKYMTTHFDNIKSVCDNCKKKYPRLYGGKINEMKGGIRQG